MKKIKMFMALVICLCMSVLLVPINADAATVTEVDTEAELREALTNGESVKLTADIELKDTTSGNVKINAENDITIDGNNYTISTTLIRKIFEVYAGSEEVNVTFKNIELTSAYSYGRCIDTRTGNINLILDGVTLITTSAGNNQGITVGGNYEGTNTITLNDSTISAGIAGYGIITFNKVDISINNSTIDGYSAIYFREASSSQGSAGSTAIINKSELVTETDTDEVSNSFGTIIFSDKNIKVEIIDSLVSASSKGETSQCVFGANVYVDDTLSIIISGESEIVVDTVEEIAGFAAEDKTDISTEIIQIKDGVISNVDVKDYVETGYRVVKETAGYVVYKENAISLEEVTNGTVTIDKETAIVGETVTITVMPNNGYELKTIKVVDADNKEIEVTDGKFVMPNSKVTVTVEMNKTTVTTELPTVDTTEEVEEVVVGVKVSEKTEEVLLESLKANKDLADEVNTGSVNVEVEINTLEEAKVDEEVVKEIKEKLGNAKIAKFFDVTVSVKKQEKEIGTLDELTEEIELMIVLPEELKNTDKNVKRTYYVIRKHGDVVEKLDDVTLSSDGNSLIFKSAQFSTYALAYEDTAVESTANPATGNSIILYIVLASLSVVGLASAGLYVNKKRLSN